MGRPANPTPQWDSDRKVWVVRITEPKPPGWPVGKEAPRKAHDLPGIREDQPERAKAVAKIVSDRVRRGEAAPMELGETVAVWAERWLDERDARGISSIADDRGRMRKHVLPVLGAYPVATITREQVERLVEDLDRKIDLDDENEEAFSWKTASNVWTLVTKMFDDAVNAKRRDLRMRQDNPAKGIKGPEHGDRKAKQYLYPSELLQLMAADDETVPARFKVLYAVAIYTFLRAGELEALEWDDVDLEHNVIQVTKAIERATGETKSTKSGETRRIPIDPNLRPLLERLHDERKRALPPGSNVTGRVLWLPPRPGDRAGRLRAHLKASGVTRADLHLNDDHRKHLTFHDLRATGITWAAVRGDDPLRIKQRAGHSGFATTEIYIREAENLGRDFGDPFPPLPPGLTSGVSDPFRHFGSKKPKKHRQIRAGHGIRTRLRGLERIQLSRATLENKPFEVAVGCTRLPEVAAVV
jgi:integrase